MKKAEQEILKLVSEIDEKDKLLEKIKSKFDNDKLLLIQTTKEE